MVVDEPVDTGFALRDEMMGPEVAVAIVVSDVEAVDDGHATGEFGLGFDIEEMIGVRGDDAGIDGNGHGDRIGEGEAVFAGLFVKGGDGAGVAIDGEGGDGIFVGEELLDFDGRENGLTAAEMPADEFDGKRAADDSAGGIGIAPDIVFGSGRYVAFATGIAAHDEEAGDVAGEVRAQVEGQGEIGKRADGDDDDAEIGFDGMDDGVDGVKLFGSAMPGSVAAIGEAVFAVEPVGGRVGASERFFGADEDGDWRVAEFGDVKGVAGGLRDGDVSGDGGDGADVDVRMTESHEKGDGVVGGGVGVDEEGNFVGHERGRITEKGGSVKKWKRGGRRAGNGSGGQELCGGRRRVDASLATGVPGEGGHDVASRYVICGISWRRRISASSLFVF